MYIGKTEYLPMEHCRIVKGQKAKNWKINQEQKKKMIQITSEKPAERFKKIKEFVSVFDILTRTLYRPCDENSTSER